MKRLTLILLFLCTGTLSFSQETTLQGSVSFVTSNNVYVKFDSTADIPIGAILQFGGKDCLQVTEKSSISLVCTPINECAISTGDVVAYTVTPKEPDPEVEEPVEKTTPTDPVTPTQKEEETTSLYEEQIRGRASISSYNLFSDVRDNRHRIMTRFSLDANHIGGSKFSVQTYLNYRNIMNTGEDYRGRTSILNVFNLNARYDATPSLSFTGGRAINPKTSSLGANDGLFVEKYFGDFYVGGIVGFRPDFEDYGLNTDLLQYGGYVGLETNSEGANTQTTLGMLEQTNAGSTDRRFLYLQHHSTLAYNLTLFGSMELDIFGNAGNETRLTNLYLSARYRFSRAVNMMVSYDSRKRIFYYETYDTQIDQLLDEDLARQGIRVRLNVRPAKILWLGASYSTRYQSDNQNQSDNFYGYATLSKIPKIGGRLFVAYNNNTSNYLSSNILSIRHSRDFFKSKLNTEIYFRMADYTYENEIWGDYSQQYYGLNLSVRLSRTWQFNILGEFAPSDLENNYRFYTRLIKRFYSKKK